MRRVLTVLSLVLAAGPAPAQEARAPGGPTFTLTETAGVERVRFPVEVAVPLSREVLNKPEAVRLFRVEDGKKLPVAVQVLAAAPPGAAAPPHARLVFLADVPAHGTARYEVALEGPKQVPGQPLQVTGDGVGTTVDTGAALFELEKTSGQVLAVVPKRVRGDRLSFVQLGQAKPVHWNPDVWAPPAPWTHTHKWNQGVAFDPARHKPDAPPVGDKERHPFFYQEARGPVAYRLARWGKMPFLPRVDAGVTYTFYAGAPLVLLRSLVEFRDGMKVKAVRNAELVFSRHQFDTAVWIAKDGKLHTAPCYDYADKDRSFKDVAKLPPDVPCLGLANERKGYGVALVPLAMKNVNRLTGKPADQGAHFYIRDYDEHGRGHPNNFHYFVRPLVLRGDYEPTLVDAGARFEEVSAVVVFALGKEPGRKYAELVRWQKALANPLRVSVE